ncbi:hypothetical protein DIPPA_12640 [Diplonema papillatum]|nr:hypothetical protein DIPPA_12640 [Diplonema papillatum]
MHCEGALEVAYPKLPAVSGLFQLSNETHHAAPVWFGSRGKRIFSARNGRWYIGNVDTMKKDSGWVRSQPHGGSDPAAVKGGWEAFEKVGRPWEMDSGINVLAAGSAGKGTHPGKKQYADDESAASSSQWTEGMPKAARQSVVKPNPRRLNHPISFPSAPAGPRSTLAPDHHLVCPDSDSNFHSPLPSPNPHLHKRDPSYQSHPRNPASFTPSHVSSAKRATPTQSLGLDRTASRCHSESHAMDDNPYSAHARPPPSSCRSADDGASAFEAESREEGDLQVGSSSFWGGERASDFSEKASKASPAPAGSWSDHPFGCPAADRGGSGSVVRTVYRQQPSLASVSPHPLPPSCPVGTPMQRPSQCPSTGSADPRARSRHDAPPASSSPQGKQSGKPAAANLAAAAAGGSAATGGQQQQQQQQGPVVGAERGRWPSSELLQQAAGGTLGSDPGRWPSSSEARGAAKSEREAGRHSFAVDSPADSGLRQGHGDCLGGQEAAGGIGSDPGRRLSSEPSGGVESERCLRQGPAGSLQEAAGGALGSERGRRPSCEPLGAAEFEQEAACRSSAADNCLRQGPGNSLPGRQEAAGSTFGSDRGRRPSSEPSAAAESDRDAARRSSAADEAADEAPASPSVSAPPPKPREESWSRATASAQPAPASQEPSDDGWAVPYPRQAAPWAARVQASEVACLREELDAERCRRCASERALESEKRRFEDVSEALRLELRQSRDAYRSACCQAIAAKEREDDTALVCERLKTDLLSAEIESKLATAAREDAGPAAALQRDLDEARRAAAEFEREVNSLRSAVSRLESEKDAARAAAAGAGHPHASLADVVANLAQALEHAKVEAADWQVQLARETDRVAQMRLVNAELGRQLDRASHRHACPPQQQPLPDTAGVFAGDGGVNWSEPRAEATPSPPADAAAQRRAAALADRLRASEGEKRALLLERAALGEKVEALSAEALRREAAAPDSFEGWDHPAAEVRRLRDELAESEKQRAADRRLFEEQFCGLGLQFEQLRKSYEAALDELSNRQPPLLSRRASGRISAPPVPSVDEPRSPLKEAVVPSTDIHARLRAWAENIVG